MLRHEREKMSFEVSEADEQVTKKADFGFHATDERAFFLLESSWQTI